jgi:hypothetical protein
MTYLTYHWVVLFGDEGNFIFPGLFGRHPAIGGNQGGIAVRLKVVDEMLPQSESGIACELVVEMGAHFIILAKSVGVVGGQVGEDIVGAEVNLSGEDPRAVFLEGVRGAIEQDGAEDERLLLRRICVVEELVAGEPKLDIKVLIGCIGRSWVVGLLYVAGSDSGRSVFT